MASGPPASFDVMQQETPTMNASQTEIRVEKVVHNWTVKNFSHCYQEYLENFVYLTKSDETLTWSVKIYPKGNGENNKDFVFLCLNRVTSPAGAAAKLNTNSGGGGGGKIGFKSRFTLKTVDGKEIEMRIHPNPSHSDYVSYIKRDVLFPQILPQDIIVVTVEIDVAVETVTTSSEDGIQMPNSDQQLIDDYQKLLKEDKFSDFTIRVGGRDVPVHRAILAARSPVFAAMLNHDGTDEAKNGCLEILDLEYEVVMEMLSFIYSGRCPRGLAELGADLLVAADKYQLRDLKLLCEKALVGALSVENACALLILGDVHSAVQLRRAAVEFVLQRPRDVTSTAGWDSVLRDHALLVTEIVNNFDKTCHSTAAPSAAAVLPTSSSPPPPPNRPANAAAAVPPIDVYMPPV